jgi:hypothetical protein
MEDEMRWKEEEEAIKGKWQEEWVL